MASRPTTIPQLDTSKTNRVAPTAGKITSGYVLNDLFPSSNANYLHGWAGDWHEWLQERSEDGATPGTDLTLRGLDALTATGNGGVLTLKGGDGGATSGNGGGIELICGTVTSGTPGRLLVQSEEANAVAIFENPTTAAAIQVKGNSAFNTAEMQFLAANAAVSASNPLWRVGHSGSSTGRLDFYLYNGATNQYAMSIANDRKVAIGSQLTSLGTVHIQTASAGSITPSSSYDDLVIESSLSTGISIYSGTVNFGGVVFGDADGDIRGAVLYDHGVSDADSMLLQAGGATRVHISGPNAMMEVNGDIKCLGSGSDPGIDATGGSTNGNGVKGTGIGTGYGVYGVAGNNSTSAGVCGVSHGTTLNVGVKGINGGATNSHGVWGEGAGSGNGIYGFGAVGGTGNGVFGTSQNGTGAGVRGKGFGVGTGVYGEAGNTAGAKGVDGIGGTGGGIGVQGTGTTSYSGVKGISGPTSGSIGVEGTVGVSDGIGVSGTTTSGTGVKGDGGTTGRGVYAVGGSSGGFGVEAVSFGSSTAVGADSSSGNGYAAVFTADATSPSRAAIRLVPQDTAPTTAEVGAMYVNSGTGKLHCYDGSTWSQCN